MTILEAMTQLDTLKPNRYTQENKLRWLTEVDAAAAAVLGREAPDYTDAFNGLLLLPIPFDGAYLRYMEAQIAYHDGAFSAYEAAMGRYVAIFDAFRRDHRRGHVPERKGVFL